MMHWMIDRAAARPLIAARARQTAAAVARSAALLAGDDVFRRAADNCLAMAIARARETGIMEIPILGVLASEDVPGWYWYADTTTESIARALEAVNDEPAIRAVLLRVQSPGGLVDGVWSLARLVGARTARAGGKRPIWVHAERATSAAYWIAAQADRIVASGTAAIGSIGVITEHVDVSRWLEEAGITVTPLYSGAAKADFHDARPLAEDARVRIQDELDQLRSTFASSVAQARGLAVDAVMATEARVFVGDAARDAGLVDAIGTLAEVRRTMADQGARQSPAAAMVARRAAKAKEHQQQRSSKMSYRLIGCRAAPGGVRAGERLAAELNRLIDNQVTEERSREDIIADMAEAAGIDVSTVNQILRGEINCPPVERLQGFADVLDVDVTELISAAEEDGCLYDQAAGDAPADSPSAANPATPPAAAAVRSTAEAHSGTSDAARVLAILDLEEAQGREAAAKELARQGLSVEAAAKVLSHLTKADPHAESFLRSMEKEESPKVGPDDGRAPAATDGGAFIIATLQRHRPGLLASAADE